MTNDELQITKSGTRHSIIQLFSYSLLICALAMAIGAGSATAQVHAGNWAQLANAIASVPNGGTVYIDNNITAGPSDVAIELARSVTITSYNGNWTITQANALERHFIIRTDTVTLQGITLKGGNTGGGIYINSRSGQSVLNVNVGAKIQNCKATNGGAIFGDVGMASGVPAPIININDGLISDCTATNGGGIYCGTGGKVNVFNGGIVQENTASTSGGGVYGAAGTEIIISGSGTISANTANANGGGVYSTGAGSSVLNTGGIISGNTASGSGGGVYYVGTGVGMSFTMEHGILDNNTAGTYGGGVYGAAGTTINIEGGDIHDNTANSGGGVSSFGAGSNVKISGGDFFNNSASSYGGGICYGGTSPGTLKMTGGNIGLLDPSLKNTANNGGGIYGNSGTTILIEGGGIAYNEANNGGGICSSGTNSSVTLNGSTVSICNNKAANGGGIYGGSSATINLTGSANISYNEASNSGGGIYSNGSSVTLNGSTVFICNNKATSYGGGIYSTYSITMYSGYIGGTNTTYANTATLGAGIYSTTGNITIAGGYITYNEASSNGGGIYAAGSGTFSIEGSVQIYYNKANGATSTTGRGGAIYYGGTGTLIVRGGYIGTAGYSNYAREGGGIYGASGTIDIAGGGFRSNRATEKGGAICYGGTGVVNVRWNDADNPPVFSGNQAATASTTGGMGGAIYMGSGTLNMTEGVIGKGTMDSAPLIGNVAYGGNGGGIYGTSSATINIAGNTSGYPCVISGNSANIVSGTGGDGGGIYAVGALTVSNNAIIGEGTVLNPGNFTNGSATGNTAEQNGGGIYSTGEGSNVTISGGTISANKANGITPGTGNGGGIYGATGTTLTISGEANINYNIATGDGGGIFVNQGTLSMPGGYMASNQADADGGGIYVNNGSVSISGATIRMNRSVNGGGIFGTADATIIVSDGQILQNTAFDNGGGIYSTGNNSNVTISGGTIFANKANGITPGNGNGGGIFYAGTGLGKLTMDGGTIGGSSSSGGNTAIRGGGIYGGSGSNIDIQGGSITGNSSSGSKSADGGGIYVENHKNLKVATAAIFDSNTAFSTSPWMTTNVDYSQIKEVYDLQCTGFIYSTVTAISTMPSYTLGTHYDNLYNNYDINLQSVKITYDPNALYGGTGSPFDKYYFNNEAYTVLGNIVPFTHPAGEFIKWNTKKNGSGTDYYPGDLLSTDSDIILYAQWGCYLELTPTSGADDQAVCVEQNITPIIYNTEAIPDLANMSQISISPSLPGSIIWSWSGSTKEITISGASAVSSSKTAYTITINTASCSNVETIFYLTVNALPNVGITGDDIICVEATTTLSPTTGGTWVSNNPGVATVTNAGVVTGVSNGTATFTFTDGTTGCAATTGNVTVSADACGAFEIWNWADLAYLNVMLQEPGQTTWKGYGMKAVLMQDLVYPGKENIYSDGTHGGADKMTACPYGMPGRCLGSYGYQNWNGLSPFDGTISSGVLGVGNPLIPLSVSDLGWDANGWIPIGEYPETFVGEFDGQGFAISGLWINRKDLDQGLFGYVNGTIKNLGVNLGVNSSKKGVIGLYNAGGIAGFVMHDNSITNCYVTGYVEGNDGVGGITGTISFNSNISQCYTTCSVYSSGDEAGGIVGSAYNATLSDCYATGAVTATNEYAGGIVGYAAQSMLSNCHATGIIKGGDYVGGIAGTHINNSSIKECFALNAKLEAPSATNFGRVSGNDMGGLYNNYAVDMPVSGTIFSGSGTEHPNGADIAACDATKEDAYTTGGLAWDFADTWTLNYAADNVTVEPGTDLPVLKVFEHATFLDSAQPPKADGCGAFEIWNWADLAYLNVMLKEPGRTTWEGYGKKAVLMQDLVYPGSEDIYSNGTHGGADKNTPCPYTDHLPDARKLSSYGYQNWEGYGTFNPSTIYMFSMLYVGDPAIPLTSEGWDENGWIPIGGVIEKFLGGFDGQGYKIDGLWIDRPTAVLSQGLFGYVDNGEIRNLGLNITAQGIIGDDQVGGIAGQITNSAITNCYVTGHVEGNFIVGGIAGIIGRGNISRCYTTCSVSTYTSAGGIVGDASQATVSDCYATGAVTGDEKVGGIVGSATQPSITNCHATGIITGDDYVGGIAGEVKYGKITGCFAFNPKLVAPGTATYVGRVMGEVSWTNEVRNYALESMTVEGGASFVAGSGLTHQNGADIAACDAFKASAYTTSPMSWDFAKIWTLPPYLNVTVTPETNLPVLKVFDKTKFLDAKQPPHVEGCEPFEIWNWADLAYLNILVNNTSEWESYGKKAVLMQDLVYPGKEDIYSDGTHGGADKMTACLYTDPERQYSSYGYQNWEGVGAFTAATVYAPASLLVGDAPPITLSPLDFGWNAGGWKPITFHGTFDGQGYKIDSLWIERNVDYQGLFGKITDDTEITNLGVNIAAKGVAGNNFVGGIIGGGGRRAVFSNCYVTGFVAGNNCIGGIVGTFGFHEEANIIQCYTTCSVYGADNVGGIAGSAYAATVSDCYATGAITGSISVGGIVGSEAFSVISKCHATGIITGTDYVGGIYGGLTMPSDGYYDEFPGQLYQCFALNPEIIAPSGAANVGRVSGITWSNFHDNYALETMLATGFTFGTPGLDTKDGADIAACDIIAKSASAYTTSPMSWNFADTWTLAYGADNVKVTPETNLPVLKVFDKTKFLDAEQPPHVEDGCDPFEIWNWADLAYLNTLIQNTSEWEGYGNKAVLMQDLVYPGKEEEYYSQGINGGADKMTPCPYTDPERRYSSYGYQNWEGVGAFTAATIYTPASLLVGDAPITLSPTDFGWDANGWIPIGATYTLTPFNGVFDGQGYKIDSLWIDRDIVSQGLFGNVYGGEIKNLGVNIAAGGVIGSGVYGDVGGIAGTIANSSYIHHCYVTGLVEGNHRTGGIVGYAVNSFVSHCYTTCSVKSNDNYAGGIAGDIYYNIKIPYLLRDCYATGAVTATNEYAGGIVGFASSAHVAAVFRCHATGVVTSGNYVGGIAGDNVFRAEIQQCFALNAEIVASGATYAGRVSGISATPNNYALASMITTGFSVTSGSKDGEDISACDAMEQSSYTTSPIFWDFSDTGEWTFDYAPNYSVVTGANATNLPILSAFKKTKFRDAEQPPHIEGCEPYEIWNWADLAYLNVMLQEPGQTTWEGYGKKAVLMQDLVYPGEEHEKYSEGKYGGADKLTPCLYPEAERRISSYGYQNWDGVGAFTAATIYAPTSLLVGDAPITLSPSDFGWDTEGWIPIGATTSMFTGRFDGQGYKIDSLWIERYTSGSNNQGLFGYVVNGEIKNLGVNLGGKGEESGIIGDEHVGGIIGYLSSGSASNCYVTGIILGRIGVGGIAGLVERSKIFQCYTTGIVEAMLTSGSCGGGIAGYAYGSSLSDCYTACYVNVISSSGISYGGGIVGYAGLTGVGPILSPAISNCHATGNVSVRDTDGTSYIGGIAGYFSGKEASLSHCFALDTLLNTVASYANYGRVSGNNSLSFQNNYALDNMKIIFNSVEFSATSGLDTKDGADIASCNATEESSYTTSPMLWDFADTWTLNYAADNVQVAPGTNLPVLKIFEHTKFYDAEQPPRVEGCDTYEIWNWADLAYLNVMLQEPGQVEWNGYGKKAVLMQDLVYPGEEEEFYSQGINGGADKMTPCPYTEPERKLSSYGYQNWDGDGDGAFVAGTIYSGALLLVGDLGIPLTLPGWNTDGWEPIRGQLSFSTMPFSGIFDGQGYKIDSLWIDRNTGSYQGLFADVSEGEIKNLGLNIAAQGIIGDEQVGGIAGQITNSAITNCYVTGDVEGDRKTGGIAGESLKSQIVQCYTTCSVYNNGDYVGGIVGYCEEAPVHSSAIGNSYATGAITATGNYAGGIVGTIINGTIFQCHATGVVTLTGITNTYIGGIAGYHLNGSIHQCFALNPKLVAPATAVCGRVSSVSSWLHNNYALETMTMEGGASPFSDFGFNNKDGKSISACDAIKESTYTTPPFAWNFTSTWILNPYTGVNVTPGTNLPVLKKFTIADFPNAEQPPKVDDCVINPFEIWNWADLAYLNLMIGTPAWESYGKQAMLMQDLVHPDAPSLHSDGQHGGASKTEICPYPEPERQLGSYGYQNWDGVGSFDGSVYSTTSLFVGNVPIPLPIYGWQPIGWKPIGRFPTPSFVGGFDGQGYKIDSLWINAYGNNNLGLFGYVESGTIKNLGVNIAAKGVIGDDHVGGVVGYITNSSINNCYVTGYVDGKYKVGGIAGNSIHTTIGGCYTTCSVYSNGNYAGGIAGYFEHGFSWSLFPCVTGGLFSGDPPVEPVKCIPAILYDCYATGAVTAKGNYAGGIVGHAEKPSSGATPAWTWLIHSCHATGAVTLTGTSNNNIGGIAGRLEHVIISQCFALNPKLVAPNKATNCGRISGSATAFEENYALESMTVEGGASLVAGSGLNHQNGEDITACAATLENAYTSLSTPWNFPGAWTFNYSPDYNVVTGANATNLPILSAFNNTDFPDAEQPPHVEGCDNTVTLSLTVFLQGPTQSDGAGGGVMTNYIQTAAPPSLFTGPKLPPNDPYGLGAHYAQINNSAGPAGAVVDWISVEIWDIDLTASYPYPYTVRQPAVALLLKPDGSVVDMLGNPPQFTPEPDPVHIVVRHRNHLAIVSKKIDLSKDATYDFSTSLDQALTLAGVPAQMVNWYGKWAMWGGEFQNLGYVTNNDDTVTKEAFQNGDKDAYLVPDVNMNGYVNNEDATIIGENLKQGYSSVIMHLF